MKNKQAFKNLPVWNDSIELVKSMYILTSVFPEEELEGIVKSLKTHAITIPGAIAKAMQTGDWKIRQQHFNQAQNSLTEIETLLIIAEKLDFIESRDFEKYAEKCDELNMRINGLAQKLNKS